MPGQLLRRRGPGSPDLQSLPYPDHRYCAGVPHSHLAIVSPCFTCIACTMKANETTVSELREEVAALKAEITLLKTTLRETQQAVAAKPTVMYSTVASRPSRSRSTANSKHDAPPRSRRAAARGGRANNQPNARETTTGVRANKESKSTQQGNRQPGTRSTQESGASHRAVKRVIVEGARRIWGTMKACPPSVVLNTIAKVTEIKEELRIRRKSKNLSGNKLVWWFVLHCNEEVLCKLDGKWEKVQAQTGWRLQCCYMPSETQPGPNDATTDPQHSPSIATTQLPPDPLDSSTHSCDDNPGEPGDQLETSNDAVSASKDALPSLQPRND